MQQPNFFRWQTTTDLIWGGVGDCFLLLLSSLSCIHYARDPLLCLRHSLAAFECGKLVVLAPWKGGGDLPSWKRDDL